MLSLIISLAVGLGVALLSRLILVDTIWGMILPFVLGVIVTFIWLARRVNRQIEALMKRFQSEMQGAAAGAPSVQARERALERGVDILKQALPYGRWMFGIEGMVKAQIGQLYYMQQKFKEARPYLEDASPRLWTARAMLACYHFKKKRHDAMKAEFEALATKKAARTDALFWNLYAWCLWKSDDRDGAIAVLARGQAHKELEKDARIQSNLDALRNGKRVKMRGWKEQWYQFHLEPPPQPKMRFDRRSMRGR